MLVLRMLVLLLLMLLLMPVRFRTAPRSVRPVRVFNPQSETFASDAKAPGTVVHPSMDLQGRPTTAELSAELEGTARRARDARVPFASRKEVERYSQLLPTLYDERGPIEYPTVRIADPPEVSVPDREPEPERAAPATGARMPKGGSRHTRSVEGLSVGNAWSGSALVSGFSARDGSSAFIPEWDTPPVVANWSYYKRGWRNGSKATTDPVG